EEEGREEGHPQGRQEEGCQEGRQEGCQEEGSQEEGRQEEGRQEGDGQEGDQEGGEEDRQASCQEGRQEGDPEDGGQFGRQAGAQDREKEGQEGHQEEPGRGDPADADSADLITAHPISRTSRLLLRVAQAEREFFLVLLPTEGREAHGRPGRIVVLEATKRGRPWPKWIVCPSWVAGRVIAYGIGVRRIGAASPGRCWNWRP